MGKETKTGTIVQASCRCGSGVKLPVGSLGRPLPCKACHRVLVVIWGIDPKSKQAAPVVLEKTGPPSRPFTLPPGMCELPCPCGQRLYARPREAGKRVECPVCATWLKLEQTRDPQTLETRIRVVKSRLNQLPAVPPAPKRPKAIAVAQEILCGCGDSLRIEPEHLGKQTQCPGCGTLISLEVTQDGAGLVVAPRVVGKAELPAKLGIDEVLILDDFK